MRKMTEMSARNVLHLQDFETELAEEESLLSSSDLVGDGSACCYSQIVIRMKIRLSKDICSLPRSSLKTLRRPLEFKDQRKN